MPTLPLLATSATRWHTYPREAAGGVARAALESRASSGPPARVPERRESGAFPLRQFLARAEPRARVERQRAGRAASWQAALPAFQTLVLFIQIHNLLSVICSDCPHCVSKMCGQNDTDSKVENAFNVI